MSDSTPLLLLSGGKVVTDLRSQNDVARSALVQPDGSIVLFGDTGESTTEFALAPTGTGMHFWFGGG